MWCVCVCVRVCKFIVLGHLFKEIFESWNFKNISIERIFIWFFQRPGWTIHPETQILELLWILVPDTCEGELGVRNSCVRLLPLCSSSQNQSQDMKRSTLFLWCGVVVFLTLIYHRGCCPSVMLAACRTLRSTTLLPYISSVFSPVEV